MPSSTDALGIREGSDRLAFSLASEEIPPQCLSHASRHPIGDGLPQIKKIIIAPAAVGQVVGS